MLLVGDKYLIFCCFWRLPPRRR